MPKACFYLNNSLANSINEHVDISVARCYQCGKCSAGCPIVEFMDYSPSLVLRYLQTELPENDDAVLRSKTIWYCLSCEMCIARCPVEVDIPVIMDFLRIESIRLRKTHKEVKNIIRFHKAFLNTIKRNGRLHEMGLVLDYKTRSLDLLQDLALSPGMFKRGKLRILPEQVKNRKEIKHIFTIGSNKRKNKSIKN